MSNINDLWHKYLRGEGYSGQVNDMMYQWLGDKGYTGSLNDRWMAALKADDVFTPVFNPVDLPDLLAYYDIRRTDTLFEESTGQPQVSGATDPIGLWLDQSQGLVLGPEVVPDPSFDNAGAWTLAGVSVTGGQAVWSGATGSNYARAIGVTVLGRWYEVTFTVDSISDGQLAVSASTGVGLLRSNYVSVAGTYTFRIFAGGASNNFQIFSAGGSTTASVSSVSVREIPGYHLSQGTGTSRPLYQLTPTRAEFDLLDDSLSVTLPAISGGQIVIVSPAGIWIDSLTFAGGTFTIGPSTYTGGPAGLLSLLSGDVTAVYILDSAMSAGDQAALVSFETARGSAGLITLGGEIVPQPVKFDSAFWTNVNVSSELDNVFTTSSAGGQITSAAFTVGRKYIVDFACVSGASVGLYNSNGATDVIGVTGVNLNSRNIFEAASTFFYVRHAAAGTVTVSTISAREVILP